MLRLAALIGWRKWVPVGVLCVTQLVSWGTLYYAFSVLLSPIGDARGWGQSAMMGAFSLCLLLTGFAAYSVGRLIQRLGGRVVMTMGSLLAAGGLAMVASSGSLTTFYLGWALLGIASAATLYEPAFAILAKLYGAEFKRALTAVVLVGGFASSIFWPLTERLTAWIGWQQALVLYAAIHLMVCAPLHWFGLPQHDSDTASTATPVRLPLGNLVWRRSLVTLTGSFMLSSAVFSIMSVQLIPILQSRGMSSWEAASLAALAGPFQVAGRLVEFIAGGTTHARTSGIVALALLICSLGALAILPWPIAAVAMYGVSNGVMTVVRGVSIAEIFGSDNYARISGAISGPSTFARAIAPALGVLAMGAKGEYGFLLAAMVGASLCGLVLFWMQDTLRVRTRPIMRMEVADSVTNIR